MKSNLVLLFNFTHSKLEFWFLIFQGICFECNLIQIEASQKC